MEPWLAALPGSEDRLRALMESSPLAIKEVDLESRVIVWNRSAERLFGWTREEMLGRPGAPMVPPSKQVEHEELVARVSRGEAYTGYQTVRRRKDGTLFEVMMAAAPVQDATGRVVGHVVVYNDISEEQAARGGAAPGADRLLAARARGVRPGHAHTAVEPGGRAHLRLVARGDARPWRSTRWRRLRSARRARSCSRGCSAASR